MLKLRPHHILCIGFYRGKGYSREFVLGMDSLVSRLTEDHAQNVELVCGADDICAFCPHFSGGRCASGQKPLEYDKAVLALCGIRPGVYSFEELGKLAREKIWGVGLLGGVCRSCEWFGLCSGLCALSAAE